MGDVQSPVIGGHVYCRERHGDIDVSTCITCDRLRALQDKTVPPYVVCEIDAIDSQEPDPRFVEWWYQHHRRGR